MKLASCRFGICVTALLWAGAEPVQAEAVKLSGWFACEKCTASRVAKGDLRPSNPECAKMCIDKGSEGVFLSEQGKESLRSGTIHPSRMTSAFTSKSPEKLIRPPRPSRSRQSRDSNMRERHARGLETEPGNSGSIIYFRSRYDAGVNTASASGTISTLPASRPPD